MAKEEGSKIDYLVCKCGNNSWFIHNDRISCDQCPHSFGLGWLKGGGITELDIDHINKRMSEVEG